MKNFLLSLFITFCTFASFAQYPNILIDNSGSPNEPSIFINPKNIQNIVAGTNLNFVFRSDDGGLTWQKDQLSSDYGVWGDPCILADTAGSFYYLHLSNPPGGNWIDRIVCQKSSDGGSTWSNGTYMGLNGARAQDKEWAIFDMLSKNIYVTWTQFDEYGTSDPNDSSIILFSKSTDLGATWSVPQRICKLAGDCIDSDNTTEGAVPAVGPAGEIYVAWSNRDTLFFDRSLDEGNTWLNDDLFVTTQPGGWDYTIPGLQRCNGLPVMKCDLSDGPYHGTIYINWTDQRNGTNNTDVFISKSTDGGASWSDPLKVNDDLTQTHQFLTWMDVDQSDGMIYMIFYDRRNYVDQNTDVYFAYSADGGESFTNVKLSDAPFDPNAGVFFGDYTNICAYMGKVAPIWTRQDGFVTSVWTAQIDFPTLTETTPAFRSKHFMLYQNAPNPFSETTTIEIDLQEDGYYTLTLFDMMGRKITDVLSNQFLRQGHQEFTVDAGELHLSESTYYYSLRKGNEIMTKRLVFVNQ